MRLKILGCRGNIAVSAPRHERHSGVLVDGRILLDLGEASYARYRPRQIFITHSHPDHAVPLTGSIRQSSEIYVPQRTPALAGTRLISKSVRIGPYRIVPVPTVHSLSIRSVGYVVEKARRRAFYSSDMVAIHPRYHHRLERLDLVITDGSFMRRGGLVRVDAATGRRFGHAGIPDLVAFFRRFTRRIVFTHFGSWFYRDVAASVRQIRALGDGIGVRAAHDGLVITI